MALRFPRTRFPKTCLTQVGMFHAPSLATAFVGSGVTVQVALRFPTDTVSLKTPPRPDWDAPCSTAAAAPRRFGRDRISASLPRALFPKRALPGWDASRSIAGRRTLLALLQVWPRLSGSGVTAQAMCSLCARRLRERALSPATGATNRRLSRPGDSSEITVQAMLHSPARRFQKRATHR